MERLKKFVFSCRDFLQAPTENHTTRPLALCDSRTACLKSTDCEEIRRQSVQNNHIHEVCHNKEPKGGSDVG